MNLPDLCDLAIPASLGGHLYSSSRLPGAVLGSGPVGLDIGGELGVILYRGLRLGGRAAAGGLQHHRHLVRVDPGLGSRTHLGRSLTFP